MNKFTYRPGYKFNSKENTVKPNLNKQEKIVTNLLLLFVSIVIATIICCGCVHFGNPVHGQSAGPFDVNSGVE